MIAAPDVESKCHTLPSPRGREGKEPGILGNEAKRSEVRRGCGKEDAERMERGGFPASGFRLPASAKCGMWGRFTTGPMMQRGDMVR